MSSPFLKISRTTLAVLAITASVLFGLVSQAHAVADDALTQHIWKLKYGVTDAQLADTGPSGWMNQDSDGDGILNKDEVAAGTNPFVASSTIRVSSITKVGANVNLMFPSELGKLYTVEKAATLAGPWGTVTTTPAAPIVGTGNSVTVSAVYTANNFYRVRVADTDTDGDGVSDWAEKAVGLNAATQTSSPGVNDYNFLAGQVFSNVGAHTPIPYVVTIRASKASASEDGPDPGTLTIDRTISLFPLTVNYTVAGTAVAGSDYTAIGSPAASVSFATGSTSQDVFVNPIAQPGPTYLPKGSRSVTATLSNPAAGQPYSLGSSTKATVIINPTTVANGTGLLARYYDTSSSTQADAANFGQVGMYAFTRGTPTTSGTIIVTFSGGAIPGLLIGHSVKMSFTSGSLNSASYNNLNWNVSAVTSSSFTASITGAPTAFSVTSTNGSCNFNIQSITPPAALTRLDSTVNFDWQHGTPNGNVIAPNNSPDNYSSTWEAYLNPTTAGNYVFQLDADDKARVLLDTGSGLTQIVEHNWTSPGSDSVGTFKQSASIPLAVPASPAQRYKIRVEHVETTGDARCRLQWSVNGGAFANIPQAQQFTHTQALSYSLSSGNAVITPTGGHSFNVNDTVNLAFSTGVLFTPGAASSYNGNYTITAVGGTFPTNTFTVALPASGPTVISGASTALNNATVTVGPTAGLGLFVGMAVSGAGLPANEFITAVGTNTITVTTSFGVTAQSSTTITASLFGFQIPITGATTSVGSPTILVPSIAGLAVGMAVYGPGLPANEFITAIVPNANGPGMISVTTGTGVTAQASTNLTAVLPATGTGNGFVLNNSASTTTGAYNLCYANTTFSNSPGRVGVDGNGNSGTVTAQNNGIWNSGTPDVNKIHPDTFSVSWTGQVQPQFTEEYTFVVQADDGCALKINGQQQVLSMFPSASTGGSTYTYDSSTGSVVINYASLVVNPNSFVVGETVRVDFTTGNLLHSPTTSPTYSYDGTTGNAVIDYTNLTNVAANGFVVGETVELDPTSGTLTTLGNVPYVITAATANTFTVNFGTGTFATGTGNITIADTRNAVITAATLTTFTVNVGANKYANASAGNVSVDIANKDLKDWSSNGNERYVRIPMIGGVRYDIQLDYYENTGAAKCLLSWYSPSQPKQIIPSERLYPSRDTTVTPTVVLAPPTHIAPATANALVNGFFSYSVSGSNGGAVSVDVSGLPTGLNYSGGVISGVPTAGGDYQIVITITNAAGTSTSVLNLHVDQNAGTVPRELWTGVSGTTVASIPTGNTPNASANLTSLQETGVGTNYGARIRGYITAPVTGNYYFWIAANDGAELWISNDGEQVNAFKRAWVTTGSTMQLNWSVEPNQQSAWLALEAGAKYYFEVLHKAGSNSGDNVAVGWLKPGETGVVPSEVVPAYVLSPYVAPSLATAPGPIYVATLLAQSGAATNGVGGSTLRLSADENTAYMKRNYSGLTGPITSEHIHSDPYLTFGSQIIFDIDAPTTPGDGLITNPTDPNYTGTDPQKGTYKWTITGVGSLSKANIIDIIKTGKAYINLHTGAYPNGEIRGNYYFANASGTFTAPAAPTTWIDDSNTDSGAARFLTQASFGANIADITDLKALPPSSPIPAIAGVPSSRYNTWIDNQFGVSATQHLPEVLAREIADAFGPFDVRLSINTWWKSSISGPDQLRQRVAAALSEIHVVSTAGPLQDNSRAISHFYDNLLINAFGNFRDVLVGTTKTPGMGRYLDMLGNSKQDLTIGKIPNENYAREIMQLFSIGLYRMWPDGSLILDSTDSPVATYTQREIVGVAHVFTGWSYGYDGGYRTSFSASADWTRLMREVPLLHDTGPKRVLNNEVLPGLQTVGGQPLDPNGTVTSTIYNDPSFQALPANELNEVHDMLFNHPNVGPFICRQLIQRLVTSNPSRDYLYRVVQKFNDNGLGVRGDMKTVIKAILLDSEARSSTAAALTTFGKQREPMMRVANAARAFRPAAPSGTYSQTGTSTITINSTGHGLTAGQDVFLEFADTTIPAQPAPSTGTYNVVSAATDSYTILAPGWITGTYSQPANSTVMTVTLSGHWLPAGGQAYFNFTSGAASGTSFDATTHTVITSTAVDFPGGSGNNSGTTFTIAGMSPTSASARSGNVDIVRFSGSYSGPTSTAGTPGTITIDTAYVSASGINSYGTQADHYLSDGENVFINFTTTRDTTSFDETTTLNDLVYPITTISGDANSFRVTSRAAANAAIRSDNGVYVFPLKSQPLTRAGNVNRRLGTFTMDNTDGDIGQTPLSSPTVFNYFLPEYKYPGTMAAQGITTPEFQTTSATTVIRHANFIYNGVFNPNLTTGISSFKTGTDALLLDLSKWMGLATTDGLGAGPQPTQYWTSNANLPTLIDHMNTLLMSGQLLAEDKTSIQNFLYRTMSSIAVSNPCSITTSTAHGLVVGDSITISGVTGGTFRNSANTATVSINQTFTVTAVTTTTFTIDISGGIRCTAAPTTAQLANAHFSPIAYNNSSPATTEIRDRLRGIIHFILTSPDYTIQR